VADLILNSGKKPGSALARGTAIAVVLGLVIVLPLAMTLRGCDDTANANVQSVKIGGHWFHLEVAVDDSVRMKGLGQRTHIEDDGGMLFVFNDQFPRQYPQGTAFVMRDCPIDIDIIYLDAGARITAMYHMTAEPPRGPDEGKAGEFDNRKYEDRLKKYPSRFAIQGAIELKGGTLDGPLKGKLKPGDKIDLPMDALKKRAK